MRQFFIVLLLSVSALQAVVGGVLPTVAMITLDEAVRDVMRQGQNKVLATRTETIDGRQIYVIKVLTPDGRIQHLKIDAQSGRPLR